MTIAPQQKQCLVYIDRENYLDLFNPNPSKFNIGDIAARLTRLNRWTGRSVISVLQHSVMVAEILPERLKLQGLMHDAAEAFTGDIPAPMKPHLQGLDEIEHALNTALAARYGYDYPFDPLVHQADKAVAKAEAMLVFYSPPEWAYPSDAETTDQQVLDLETAARGRVSKFPCQFSNYCRFMGIFLQHGGKE